MKSDLNCFVEFINNGEETEDLDEDEYRDEWKAKNVLFGCFTKIDSNTKKKWKG